MISSYKMCPMGAHPIGKPGCPEFAFSTASMARNRIELIDFSIRESVCVSSTVWTATARMGERGIRREVENEERVEMEEDDFRMEEDDDREIAVAGKMQRLLRSDVAAGLP
jgi:hypothetical protein